MGTLDLWLLIQFKDSFLIPGSLTQVIQEPTSTNSCSMFHTHVRMYQNQLSVKTKQTFNLLWGCAYSHYTQVQKVAYTHQSIFNEIIWGQEGFENHISLGDWVFMILTQTGPAVGNSFDDWTSFHAFKNVVSLQMWNQKLVLVGGLLFPLRDWHNRYFQSRSPSWFRSHLPSRWQFIYSNNCTFVFAPQSQGIPQGWICCPLSISFSTSSPLAT